MGASDEPGKPRERTMSSHWVSRRLAGSPLNRRWDLLWAERTGVRCAGWLASRGMAEYDNQLEPNHPEPLWREVTGRVLRRYRHDRGERLVETAQRAGVSTQYLSELERGRKDASSEILAAVAGALGLTWSTWSARWPSTWSVKPAGARPAVGAGRTRRSAGRTDPPRSYAWPRSAPYAADCTVLAPTFGANVRACR